MTTPATITFATATALSLTFRFLETDWYGRFDRIEVWRSRLTEAGPWEEITGPSWAPANLVAGGTGSAPQLAPLVGRVLTLQVNEFPEFSCTFTGTDPIALGSIASQIQAASNGLVVATAGTVIDIDTVQPGAAAVLKVIGGDAVPILGLSSVEPTSLAFGQDPRIPLAIGTETYQYTDPHGSSSYWYRTRLRNSTTGLTGEFSSPIPGTVTTALDPSNLVLGEVRLVDVSGRAMANRRILLDVPNQYLRVSSSTVFGYRFELLTDTSGYASVQLVRGLRLRLTVAGSSMVRDITAPTDSGVGAFDLFDPTYSTGEDIWKVQQPNLDYAVRRS